MNRFWLKIQLFNMKWSKFLSKIFILCHFPVKNVLFCDEQSKKYWKSFLSQNLFGWKWPILIKNDRFRHKITKFESNYILISMKNIRFCYDIDRIFLENFRIRMFLIKNLRFWYDIDYIFRENFGIRLFLIKNIRL